MEMQIGKGRDGWEAKTTIDMGADSRVLIVSTRKTTGGMVTSAMVNKRDGAFLAWDMFGDFNQRTKYPGARCTEKTVRDLHQLALGKIEETMAAARAHYAAKKGAAA